MHDALHGQIHADLMRYTMRGIREDNIRCAAVGGRGAVSCQAQHSAGCIKSKPADLGTGSCNFTTARPRWSCHIPTLPVLSLCRLSHKACRDNPGLYICVLISNGTVYLTSLKPRNAGGAGHATMAAGFLLELYEASLRFRWVVAVPLPSSGL